MPPPQPFSSPHNMSSFPALYLYPLNDTFVPKHIALVGGQRVKIGRQTNAKTVPAERNGYFDSKVLSRQHAEIWEENGKIFIKDVKSSNGTFINGERLSQEGIESEQFELKNDDIVEFGIDIIGEDNKTTIHHKVAARVLCVFTEDEVQVAARVEQMQNNPGVPSQQNASGAVSQFSFAQGQVGPPAQRRPTLQSQALGGMGGMGGSMRPPGKSGLSFDHILSRLQGELQKSRDTGAELHSLTTAMSDIHDTLGGTLPPNLPHYPHTLPPVRPPQAITEQSGSGSIPTSALNELRSQLHETQASLASHVDKVRALEDMLAEHEAIKAEVASLRDFMDERKRELDSSSHAAGSPSRHHDGQLLNDLRRSRYQDDDDDASSIHTIVPHELERVEEEDEDQLVPEEEDDEDRRRRRDELGRPRTPEPTGMGMIEDDEESLNTKRVHQPSSLLRPSHDAASAAIGDLAERLSALSGRIDAAVEYNTSLQAQHTAAQMTISLLQSKIATLEELVQATQSQLQQQSLAQEAAHAEILKAVREPPHDTERESLTAMLNEWKKGVEGQWSAAQEEWSQERERLSKAREEWENRARTLELGLDAKITAGVASITALQRHHPFPNGDIKINGTGGLVTPPSPVSVASNSGRTKSRRRRTSSSRGRSRSSSPISSIELIEGVVNGEHDIGTNPSSRRASDQYQRSRSPSPSIAEDSDPESCKQELDGTQYLFTPAPSVKDSPGHPPLTTSVELMSKTETPLRTTETLNLNMTTAVGVLVLGIATAAVLWRVKPE
ncbi:hypothetical protein PAXINDRAFT_138122 [Paxillus involutus ATCC 200175]|uniref:FHA domain-containing protein n=1 Tax=Paxillus involutus ATCC 200175 TaxID=664439 RepID=A0A0C9TKA6_PAXIN|nr:hypothetical protein PAXINDRAFT_138122 [Paxillus involutus ATCC 200175]